MKYYSFEYTLEAGYDDFTHTLHSANQTRLQQGHTLELIVEYDVSPGRSGKYHGDPNDCHPAEGAEITGINIYETTNGEEIFEDWLEWETLDLDQRLIDYSSEQMEAYHTDER